MQTGLSELLKTITDEVVAEFPSILVIYLFGSHAAGKPGSKSDVDIAVFTDGSEGTMMDLELGLFLQQRLGCPVDVVIMQKASPVLKYEVLRSKIRIFDRDPEKRAILEVKALREFWDAQYYQAKRFRRRR